MFRGRQVLVLGLAREGVSLIRFLVEEGARVTVADPWPRERLQRWVDALAGLPVRYELGRDDVSLVNDLDVLFVSPGVPESNPLYAAALDRSIPVESMTTLFFQLCPGAIVGITGSSGKTTTTGLIGQILAAGQIDVCVGGNIGRPMLDLLPDISADTTVVLELSSFQLEILRRSPHVAVVTNISPNHLDRHGSMERYIAAKRHIVEHQAAADLAVLNADDPQSAHFAAATSGQIRWFGFGPFEDGATVQRGQVGLRRSGEFVPVMAIDDIPLIGRHNVENVLAALASASIFRVEPEAMAAAVREFRPAPHRLQTVMERDGVRYIDDSIATSPARAMVALQAIEAPVLLIAGGRDKNLPWDEFAGLVAQKARALLLLGEAADTIAEAVQRALSPSSTLHSSAIVRCATLQEAVEEAGRLAVPGDVVLLSPGCTSYDMFRNFEERGDTFARSVEALCAV